MSKWIFITLLVPHSLNLSFKSKTVQHYINTCRDFILPHIAPIQPHRNRLFGFMFDILQHEIILKKLRISVIVMWDQPLPSLPPYTKNELANCNAVNYLDNLLPNPSLIHLCLIFHSNYPSSFLFWLRCSSHPKISSWCPFGNGPMQKLNWSAVFSAIS